MTVLAGRGELWSCNLRCTLWERTFKTAICSAAFQPFCAFRETLLHQRASRQRKKGKRLREKEREGHLGEGCMGFEGMCAVLGALWTPKCLLQATGPRSFSLSVTLPGSLALSLVAQREQKGGGFANSTDPLSTTLLEQPGLILRLRFIELKK